MEQLIADYLTRQVQIDRNVVTFRSLSRQFNIHVNVAKNNLAAFHAATRGSSDPVHATYMLTGEVASFNMRPSHPEEDRMEVDTDGQAVPGGEQDVEAGEPDSEIVPLTKVLLVGENDVDKATTQYSRLLSHFVYSLSPARLIDSSLVCAQSEKVYEADAKLKADASTTLGRVSGPHVHIGKPVALTPLPARPAVTPAKSPEPAPAKSDKQDDKPKLKLKEVKLALKPKDDKPTLKPKLSGFLDFGKAKAKQKEEGLMEGRIEAEKAKEKGKSKVKSEEGKKGSASAIQVKEKKASPPADVTEHHKPEAKRGVKRKSALPLSSDEEGEAQESAPRKKSPIVPKDKERETEKEQKLSTSKSSATKTPVPRRKSTRTLMSDSDEEDTDCPPRVAVAVAVAAKRKSRSSAKATNVVLSDSDEESENIVRSSKTKTKTMADSSAVDKSLRAMMDIDDDEVIKASRPVTLSETEPESEEEIPPETQTEDIIEDSEPERAKQRPQKRKKQQKKPVPVGRNGLKKRPVMRTRTKTDEKGYMVTEDYSSYESVDEEEPEESVKAKGKRKKGSTATQATKNPEEHINGEDAADTKAFTKEDSKAKTAEKPAKARKPAKKGGQGSIMNFFNNR